MSRYTRPRIAGAKLFLTINLADRNSALLIEHIEDLRAAVKVTRRTRPFGIDAWVVLPDHMHCIWTLPQGDTDYARRVQAIKAQFSRQMPCTHRRASHVRRREKGIWQRRFWEHHIRDPEDYRNHLQYCWQNPVKHGLVTNVQDWPYSSWHRDHP